MTAAILGTFILGTVAGIVIYALCAIPEHRRLTRRCAMAGADAARNQALYRDLAARHTALSGCVTVAQLRQAANELALNPDWFATRADLDPELAWLDAETWPSGGASS